MTRIAEIERITGSLLLAAALAVAAALSGCASPQVASAHGGGMGMAAKSKADCPMMPMHGHHAKAPAEPASASPATPEGHEGHEGHEATPPQ